MKKLQYRLEFAVLWLLVRFVQMVPLDAASSFGAKVARIIGPRTRAHRTALANLRHAFPEADKAQIDRIASGMWENLGRIVMEYPSLPGTRLASRMEVSGAENAPKPGQGAFMLAGHIGNWELICPLVHGLGVNLAVVYRHANNPYVDKMLVGWRRSHSNMLIPKGTRGGIHILSTLKKGGTIAMLVDQKTNNGIRVPFFGRDAMTSPAIAEIALKYDVPIIPMRIVRTGGAHFKGIMYPAMAIERTGDHKQDVKNLMVKINALLESWIRENPEQWFWVHKRWPR